MVVDGAMALEEVVNNLKDAAAKRRYKREDGILAYVI
jgi:hypothetical protein